MLEFHVTNEIFDDVKNKNKRHEYREYKPYWIKRLSELVPPLMANIVKGYSKEKIPITITKIEVIERSMIDVVVYRERIKTMQCFDIEYKRHRCTEWRMSYRLSNIAVYQCKECGKELRKKDVI